MVMVAVILLCTPYSVTYISFHFVKHLGLLTPSGVNKIRMFLFFISLSFGASRTQTQTTGAMMLWPHYNNMVICSVLTTYTECPNHANAETVCLWGNIKAFKIILTEVLKLLNYLNRKLTPPLCHSSARANYFVSIATFYCFSDLL